MKIIFFNRFFYPDTSATSQIGSDLAFHLAAKGREVHAVSSRVPHGEAVAESIRGVSFHRVAGSGMAARGLARRALAYLDYYRGARRAARSLVRAGDIVVLMTDPPLLSSAIGHLAKRRGAKVVVWLQDVFPEVAHAYGIPGTGGLSGAVLRRMRNRSLAIADRVVAIGELMADRIRRAGLPRGHLSVIHNWSDAGEIVPTGAQPNPSRERWRLGRDFFVVGYSGNLGRVHEFGTLLDAAARLRHDHTIRFLIVGRGPRLEEVKHRVTRDGLANVQFEPHQDRAALSETLGAADVHVSILRGEFEGLVQPSKLYGIMAAARPTIFIGDPRGETASIIANAECGITVPTGDADALVAAIVELRSDPAERARMGAAARAALESKFAMTIAIGEWEKLLESLVTS